MNWQRGLLFSERAMHIAERKRLYEEAHPETKQGGTRKGSSRQVGDLDEERFTADTAAKTGTSERAKQGDAAALSYVISTNLHRRHLNESQRAMVAAELANLERGGAAGVTKSNVEISTSPISSADAARKLNVSRDSVQKAKVVRDQGAT